MIRANHVVPDLGSPVAVNDIPFTSHSSAQKKKKKKNVVETSHHDGARGKVNAKAKARREGHDMIQFTG